MDTSYCAYVERLCARLPARLRQSVTWLLQPGRHWVRIPVGLLFVILGCFGFLPVLGFWMVPVGVLLLAEDLPWLRAPTIWAIETVLRLWRGLLPRRP